MLCYGNQKSPNAECLLAQCYLDFNCLIICIPGTVTPSMLEEDENINAIRQLTEQFDEVRHCEVNTTTSTVVEKIIIIIIIIWQLIFPIVFCWFSCSVPNQKSTILRPQRK